MDLNTLNRYSIYFLSPLFYICVTLAGRAFTSQGIGPWYHEILKPSYTPPGSIIGIIWTVIYILAAISLIMYTNAAKGDRGFWLIIALYIANGIINAAWSYIFFTKHLIGFGVIDSGLIWVTVLLIIVFAWRYSKAASILLIPYLGWVSFATYLTYVIYTLN